MDAVDLCQSEQPERLRRGRDLSRVVRASLAQRQGRSGHRLADPRRPLVPRTGHGLLVRPHHRSLPSRHVAGGPARAPPPRLAGALRSAANHGLHGRPRAAAPHRAPADRGRQTGDDSRNRAHRPAPAGSGTAAEKPAPEARSRAEDIGSRSAPSQRSGAQPPPAPPAAVGNRLGRAGRRPERQRDVP